MQQGKQQPQHQPADGPAFWNITHNFKPGELESDLSKMFFNQALDLHKENEALKQHIKRLEDAGDEVEKKLGCGCGCYGLCKNCQSASENWRKARGEAKL
jgi:hypothetical protein